MSELMIEQSLQKTVAQTRQDPANADLRMQLFRIMAVLGQWDRARNQLEVATNLDSELALTTMAYAGLIMAERLRDEVFAGVKTPVVLGEPEAWLAMLVQALSDSDPGLAAARRSQAMVAAPATAGAINGSSFEWIADADSRLGPVCEVMLDGKYLWVPFSHLKEIRIEAPGDWLDMVWLPAELTFVSGGSRSAFIPTRYPGSHKENDELRLARATDWQGADESGWFGLGQRVLTTDSDEYGLLDARVIALDPEPDQS